MTTRFGDSLELQGNATDLSSTARLPSTSEAKNSQAPPKRKRGRPRKVIPLEVLASARNPQKEPAPAERNPSPGILTEKKPSNSSGRRGKKKKASHDFFEDDFFDLDGPDTPFLEEELSTLDEFEKISNPSPKTETKSLTRLDQPSGTPAPAVIPRRKKVARRRQIDPATCERDYSADELEFMNALSEYKRSSGRMFPTCSEILEVLKSLGYEKRDL